MALSGYGLLETPIPASAHEFRSIVCFVEGNLFDTAIITWCYVCCPFIPLVPCWWLFGITCEPLWCFRYNADRIWTWGWFQQYTLYWNWKKGSEICQNVAYVKFNEYRWYFLPLQIWFMLRGDYLCKEMIRSLLHSKSRCVHEYEQLIVFRFYIEITQGYRYHKLRKTFGKFFRSYSELLSKFGDMSFQEYLSKGISHPVFYGDLVYKLRRVKDTPNFISSGSKIVKR